MPSIFRVFFFSFMVFVFTYLPVLARQADSESSLKGFRNEETIIDDFLVNDDVGTASQLTPAISLDGSGNFIITWQDFRNGIDWDIYAQRYNSSGIPLNTNFKVNKEMGAFNQKNPAIAVDNSGNFVITWEDNRNGQSDIYAQKFNFLGSPLGSNFRVNDNVITTNQYSPVIAMSSSGNFIITWQDYRNGNYDIYTQRYNSNGTTLSTNYKVNDDTGTSGQEFPSIAIDDSGNFVITWEDYRNGDWDIYAQRFNSAGSPHSTNFKVNDDAGAFSNKSPCIATDSSGNFTITWRDERNGNSDIYAQRFIFSGIPLGSNFKVNDDTAITYQGYPVIATNVSGSFAITWQDYRNGNRNIYAQRYNSSGSPSGSNFRVNDDTGAADQYSPTIAMDDSDFFTIVWQDDRNKNFDIYAQRYSPASTPLGSNFKVNKDIGTFDQEDPAISADGSGDFILAWQDYRKGNWDIYAQRYNPSGNPLGFNFQVNDDTGTAFQRYPVIVMDNSGNFIITWVDYRNMKISIYAQRYNSSGNPISTNFKVNDDTGSAEQYYPSISVDKSGNFVITWQDSRNGTPADIYAQRYNSSGAPLGPNFKVNDDTGYFWHESPAIAMDGSGYFIITWRDHRNLNADIYAQRYNPSGNPMGSNFQVNDDTGTSEQDFPAIAIDGSDNFVITWYDYRNGNYDIYAQRYDISGTLQGSNFKVNDDTETASQRYPAIAMDSSGNFVITWQDYRSGYSDIYAQKYNSSGNPLKINYLVPKYQYPSFEQLAPAVAVNNSNIYFAWMVYHRGSWDIYAKVVDWIWTEVEEDQNANLPNSFELYQNYPNPFNPTTTIPFSLKIQGSTFKGPIPTTLKIYNILGQLVKTVVNEEKLPGNYSVIWDGKDNSGKEVTSGIYFYQLKTKDYKDTKKMILLR